MRNPSVASPQVGTAYVLWATRTRTGNAGDAIRDECRKAMNLQASG